MTAPTLKLAKAEQVGWALALSRGCLVLWPVLILSVFGLGYWLFVRCMRRGGSEKLRAACWFCAYAVLVLWIGFAY